jgi:arsenate reductase
MAEGFARRYGEGVVNVYSAGLSPAGVVSEGAKKVMAEKGIDISGQRSKALDEINLNAMDAVITLGCCTADSFCPITFKGNKIDWDIEDPIGRPLETFRSIRDKIEEQVKKLIESIK